MSLSKRVGLLAGTAALSLTSGSLAGTGADADKISELEKRLAATEAKLAQVTSTNQDNWLTDQRAGEIRNIVQDVLADADTRASLLTQGVTAGYDNGAVLGSSDGNWLLRTNLLMQQRFVYNNQGDAVAVADASDENIMGFENTRTKFIMSGHVVNPDWFYRVDIDVSSPYRGGVSNAYLGYNYGNGWKVAMGSMKAPFLREELVESQHQLAAERSDLNYAFTGGYVDGISWMHEADNYRFAFAFTDGAGTGQSAWAAYDTEWAFTGRFEYLAQGNWGQFKDFTSPQGSEQGMMFGAAFHYQKGEYGTTAGPEVEALGLTIDASIEGDGWNLYAAYVRFDLDDDTTGGVDVSPDGFLIQGGYYLAEDWEAFARIEMGDADGASTTEDLEILTIGVTKYIAGHNLKWTTDFVYGMEEFDSVFTGLGAGAYSGLTGTRSDETGEDGQYALRTQIQLLF